MKSFDVQSIELNVPRARAHAFIADPTHLPEWTNAFAAVAGQSAVMRTPAGEVSVGLEVQASAEQGTVDWRMIFPDESIAAAYSRVIELDPTRCVYNFVLTAPPVPLEELEGALEVQSRTLALELERLKRILEHHG